MGKKKTESAVADATEKKVAAIAVELTGDDVRVLKCGVVAHTFGLSALSDDVKNAALFHGIKQKLVDAAAMSRNTETGAPASIEDKFAAVLAIAQRLESGHWNRPAGEASATGGILVSALCKLYPNKTRADILAFVAGKSKAEQAALRASPKIAPVIAEIQAAAGAGYDSEELLSGLE